MCRPHNPRSPPWLSLWIRTNWGKWLMFNEQVASLEGHIWSQGQAAESFSLGLVLLWRSCVSMRPCKDRLPALLCQVSLRIPPATWMVRREVWWRVFTMLRWGSDDTCKKSNPLLSDFGFGSEGRSKCSLVSRSSLHVTDGGGLGNYFRNHAPPSILQIFTFMPTLYTTTQRRTV